MIDTMINRFAGNAEVDRHVLRCVGLIMAAFLVIVGFVNASTLITDAAREGRALDPSVPWILEYSSVLVIVGLVPAVAIHERRFQLRRQGWPTALLALAIGSVVFCALHLAGMILLRHLAFEFVLDRSYRFFDDPLTDLFYEYRKDVVSYTTIVLMLTLMRAIEEQRSTVGPEQAGARAAERLRLKSGSRILLLEPDSIDWAQAAANYVDIHANGATHLARISLAGLERKCRESGVDVVRVHRSRLVNRAKILEIIPSRDGDFRVRMHDGSELKGSRRYRHSLQALAC